MRLAPFLIVALFLGSFVMLVQCRNLAPLPAGVCGDGVVNPGEDCDGFASDAAQSACGSPDAGALACRYDCVGLAQCPAGFNCGIDQICRQPTGTFAALGEPLAVGAVGVTLADFNGDGVSDALTRGLVNAAGASRNQVNYLGSDGSSLGVFLISDKIALPSVADVNGDGLADIVAAVRELDQTGVSVFLGQSTNALAIQAFPSEAIPSAALSLPASTVRTFALSGFPDGLRTVFFMGTTGGTYAPGLYVESQAGLPDISAPNPPGFIPLPEGPDRVVGEVQLVQLFDGTTATGRPCPSLVYELESGAVRVVSPCRLNDDGTVTFAGPSEAITPPLVTTVSLPSASLTGCFAASQCSPGVQVGDVDGDGVLDLVVSATYPGGTSSQPYATYVAYGDGEGNFSAIPANGSGPGSGVTSPPLTVALETGNGTIVPSVQIGATFAVGDLNGDSIGDFVTRVVRYSQADAAPLQPDVTVLVSKPSDQYPGGVYQEIAATLAWQHAVLADFNGDGRLDVIGGGAMSSGLEFITGSTLPDFTFVAHEFVLSSTGGVGQLAVGDFDGDGISDVAFDQNDEASGSVDVEIAYGNASGPPGAPVTVGRFASVAQISSTPPNTELQTIGANVGAAGTLVMSRFSTVTGGRPPLSSQALAPYRSGVTAQLALGAVAGAFVDAGSPDAVAPLSVVAFGQNNQTNDGDPLDAHYLWLLQGMGVPASGAFSFASPVGSTSALPSDFWPNLEVGNTTNQALLIAAAPLVASGPTALVAVSSDTAEGDSLQSVLFVQSRFDPSSSTLGTSSTPTPGQAAPRLIDSTAGASPTVATDGQIGLVDLDGDGATDLVLLTGTGDSADEVITSRSRSLLVFWGDGAGGFGLRSQPAFPASRGGTSCGDAGALDVPQGFTVAQVSRDAVPTLAFVTSCGGVHFVRFGGAGASRAHPESTTPVLGAGPAGEGGAGFGPVGPLGGFTGVSAGDINGDGVSDIAVVRSGSLYFYVGTPVNK